MSGYTKLFSDIVDSSIWKESPDVCKVWITLLALCDADGYVRGSPGWLADKACVPVETCQKALDRFASPDPKSRTPDNEGRRIEFLPDGWLILNYLAFRDRLSNDAKASATRDRVRKHRERYKALRNAQSVTSAVSASASVSVSSSGISGEGGVGEERPPRDGLLGLVDRIRSCRPEYANMREQDIVAILNGNSDTKAVERVIVDWCVEQGNALTPMGNPIASLRKRIAAIAEADEKNPYAKFAKEGAR